MGRKATYAMTIYRESLILCISIFVFGQSVNAQDNAILSQYWAIPTYYNPAAVGTTDFIRFRGAARLQWVGIHGFPRYFAASTDAPFKFLGKKLGVGVVVQHQRSGINRVINVNAQLGYKLNLLKGELTLGIQAGYINKEYRGSEFVPDESIEKISGITPQEFSDLPITDISGGAMDLGLGVHYRRGKTWFGLSLQHANKPSITFTSTSGINQTGEIMGDDANQVNKDITFNTHRSLYFTTGSNIKVKSTLLELIPSMLVRTDFTDTDVILTGRVRYNKLISAGVGYRYKDAVSVMLAVEYQGFFIGYDYDINTSSQGKGSSGSHEIIAGYSLKLDFGEKNRFKQKSIRIL
ncbi:MAG: PorP/SprF family type IX secretion system membrane protein [Duncaniella sp.]|nr:PorP/SprF family type IX secretion system membrane protein [Duncaniella sp.]